MSRSATAARGQRGRPAPAARGAAGRDCRAAGETAATCWWSIVNNQPGVLNRVASLVRARNFNIESLAVGHTERPDISRMTITLRGDDFAVEQMEKQLYRLIDVLKVQDMPGPARRARAGADQGPRDRRNRAEMLKIVELYKGRVLDVAPDAVIVEYGGTEQEVDA